MVEIESFPRGHGIEDFGNYPEGFCFRLYQIIPVSQYFVICTSDLVNNKSYINLI
jgi:hypothetical protein